MKRAYHLWLGGVAFPVDLHDCVDLELLLKLCVVAVLIDEALLGACLLLAALPDDDDGHLLGDLHVNGLDQKVNSEVLLLLFYHFKYNSYN